MKINCSYSEMRDIDLLVENPKNPNKHPEKQIKLLAKILDFQGWRSPIVVSKQSGFVVAGHGRLEAARLNGWIAVPIDLQDFETPADEYAHVVADNKIAELAQHDDALMIEELRSNGDLEDLDLELLGIPDLKLEEIDEVKNTSAELDLDSFKEFDHQCPKCGFEWSDDGSDNS